MCLSTLINKTFTKITKIVKNKQQTQHSAQLIVFLANNKIDSIFMLFTLSTYQCYSLLINIYIVKKNSLAFLLPFHKTSCCVFFRLLQLLQPWLLFLTLLFYIILFLLFHWHICPAAVAAPLQQLPVIYTQVQPHFHQKKKTVYL